MDILWELDKLLDPDQLNVIGRRTDLAEALYEAMKNEGVRVNKEGEERFYPGRRRAGDQLARLQKGLVQRMTNSLLSQDGLHKGYWEKYYHAYKALLLCDMLRNKGRLGAVATVATDTLKVADKHHFTALAAESCRMLTYHYSVVQANPKRYREYKARQDEKSLVLEWENRAYDYYHELALELRTAKTVGPDLIQQTEAYKASLDEAPAVVNSFTFQRMRYTIQLILYRMTNDLGKIVLACREALDFFNGLPFQLPPQARRSIYFNLIPAYLQSGAYLDAQESIEQVKNLLHASGSNWISIHQYQVILGFHTRDLALVNNSLAVMKKNKLQGRVAEEAVIYQLYLDILEGQEELKLGRFLNEVPTYAADKKGMNINILILQLLIFLQRNDRPAIIDRMEAVQAYAYRYLAKDPAMRRSELFFRMLFLLAKSTFELAGVERRSPGIIRELKETPRHISAIDIEIVPYELLWEKVQVWCAEH